MKIIMTYYYMPIRITKILNAAIPKLMLSEGEKRPPKDKYME